MKLSEYPQPYENNGRGIHWSSSPKQWGKDNWDFWKKQLIDANISTVKVLDNQDGLAEGLIKRLLDLDIMPIVRFYIAEQNPSALVEIAPNVLSVVKKYVKWGVRYIETNNEPDSNREWGGNRPDDWLEIVTRNFLTDWKAITDVGAIAGFPCFSFGGGRKNPFELIADWNAEHVFERMWIPIHNYGLNRPVDYPNDQINLNGKQLTIEEYEMYGGMWAFERPLEHVNKDRLEQKVNKYNLPDDNFSDLIMEDFTCWRAFERFNSWFSSISGFSVPIITTEGGFNVGAFVDGRYPKLNPKFSSEMQIESEKRDWPEYYFSDMYWLIACNRIDVIATDFETQSLYTHWWDSLFDTNGELPLIEMWKNWEGKIRGSGEKLSFYNGVDLTGRDFDDDLKYTEPPTLLKPANNPIWRLQEVKFDEIGTGNALIRCKDNDFIEGMKINSKQDSTITLSFTKSEIDNWYGNVPIPDTENGVELFVGDDIEKSDVLTGVKEGTVRLTFIKEEIKMNKRPGIWGINGAGVNQSLIDKMYSWNPGAITCFYDYLQANGVNQYHEKYPNAPIIIRFQHDKNWHENPSENAKNKSAQIISKWPDIKHLNPYVYFCNEMNLHYENGDKNQNNQHLYTTPEFYEKYADWVTELADRIKHQIPEMNLVCPPFAYGHDEDGVPDDEGIPSIGWAGYEYLVDTINKYFNNIICGHYYWGNHNGSNHDWLYGDESKWHAFRWRKVLSLFENYFNQPVKMIIDECGNFATHDSDFTEQIMYYADETLSDDRIIAMTYFLFDDPTNDAGNMPNSWQRIPDLDSHLESLKNWQIDIPQPLPPEPPTPTQNVKMTIERGEGLHLIVGNWLKADEELTFISPFGNEYRVYSGFKKEFGEGGFEIYASEQGDYELYVDDFKYRFTIPMNYQFTKLHFEYTGEEVVKVRLVSDWIDEQDGEDIWNQLNELYPGLFEVEYQ